MKIKLLDCKKCGRLTIQAETKKPKQGDYGFVIMVKFWYCPNCGNWEYQKRGDMDNIIREAEVRVLKGESECPTNGGMATE